MAQLWLTYALLGWGLNETLVVLKSLPDPPPPPEVLRWFGRAGASIIGAILGAAVARASSDPMPLLPVLGALAGSVIVVSAVRTFMPRIGR